MSIQLTDKDYFTLSQFSYLDFIVNRDEFTQKYQGQTLNVIVSDLLKQRAEGNITKFVGQGAMRDEDFRLALEYIQEHPELGKLVLKDYANQNRKPDESIWTLKDGFVAYAFEDPGPQSKDTCFAFRVTEGDLFQNRDWYDNLNYVADFSFQFPNALKFVKDNQNKDENENPIGEVYLTGHSKGGANAA